MGSIRTASAAPLFALLLCHTAALALGCSTPRPTGHTFKVIEEAGVPVAVNSAIPKYEGELFDYEKILSILPDPHNQETLLYRPAGFTLGDDGLYYVADRGNHRIVVFDESGRYVRSFGRQGEGPGELLAPGLVEVVDGIVYVFDERTNRFRCDGTFIDVLQGGSVVRLAGDGTKVAEDTIRGTAEGGGRTSAAVARMLDADGDVIAEVTSGHARSATWMQYRGEPSVFLLPGDEILATAGVEPTIDYYGLDANLKRRVRIDLPPQPVTDADIAVADALWDQFLAGHESTEGSGSRDHLIELRDRTSYPDEKAFWGRPIVEDGRWVWLPESVPVMRISTIGAEPIAAPARFRIVDSSGEFIGTSEWPPEAVLQSGARITHGHLLVMVWEDEVEELVPTVYRLRSRVDGLVYP